MTPCGYKNHYNVSVQNQAISYNMSQLYMSKEVNDAHPLLRYHAQYRNYSRKIKQYLYGNKYLENMATLWLKEKFNFVLKAETPIELVQPYPDDRLVAQGDRDYELVHGNVHPYQLEFYSAQNEHLKEERENQALRDNGQQPLDDQFIEIASQRIKSESDKKGEPVNSQELHKIFEEVYTAYRAAQGSEALRTPTGDFKDFVEFRRPYIEPGVNNVNVKIN